MPTRLVFVPVPGNSARRDAPASFANRMNRSQETPLEWIPLCPTADVSPDEPRRVEVEGHAPFAVFQVAGEYFVTDDTCTHGQASLSEGFLEGDEIECPWHQGRFCIRDGRATQFPATEPINVYPARVIDGVVHAGKTRG